MVRWPLDLAAGDGTALRACSQAQAPPPDNPEGTGMFSLWAEWEVALLLLAGFIASLGEELEAGAAGAPRGTRKCPEGGGLQSGLVPDGSAAGQVARRTVKWPPPDPAPLAAAAAAALLLLSRWHALRAVLVPEAFAERAAGARSGTVSLDLQRDLPKACRQLVAAAAAALDGSRKSRLMRQALPAALDAAATACKLVRLACCDAAHWALLGAAAAANAGSPEGRPAAYEPYQPVALALAAAGAAERGARRLLLAQGALQQPEAAYLRRCGPARPGKRRCALCPVHAAAHTALACCSAHDPPATLPPTAGAPWLWPCSWSLRWRPLLQLQAQWLRKLAQRRPRPAVEAPACSACWLRCWRRAAPARRARQLRCWRHAALKRRWLQHASLPVRQCGSSWRWRRCPAPTPPARRQRLVPAKRPCARHAAAAACCPAIARHCAPHLPGRATRPAAASPPIQRAWLQLQQRRPPAHLPTGQALSASVPRPAPYVASTWRLMGPRQAASST